MRLTRFSDYALRVLIHLSVNPGRLVPVAEVARAFGISYHHLTKVATMLAEAGVVEAVRGRGGGVRLLMRPDEIRIGWLVQKTEPDFHLVECFDSSANHCPITPACSLRALLHDAKGSFLSTLNQKTVADIVNGEGRRLAQIIRSRSGAVAGPALTGRVRTRRQRMGGVRRKS